MFTVLRIFPTMKNSLHFKNFNIGEIILYLNLNLNFSFIYEYSDFWSVLTYTKNFRDVTLCESREGYTKFFIILENLTSLVIFQLLVVQHCVSLHLSL